MELPDIQATSPEIQLNITRVGVKGIKKLLEVASPGVKRPLVFICELEMYVDLPAQLKGANLSRNIEAMYSVVEEACTHGLELDEICLEIARKLLQKHPYASRSEVKLHTEYMLSRRAPVTGLRSQEFAQIWIDAWHLRNGKFGRRIGVEVPGIIACPCTQEILREKIMKQLESAGVKGLISSIPIPTHNQRGRGYISVELNGSSRIDIQQLIQIIDSSMSSSTYGLLKRADEAYIVEQVHLNPKFVEDCVREMALKLAKLELPEDAIIKIRQLSQESIHSHDLFAEKVVRFADLRKELNQA